MKLLCLVITPQPELSFQSTEVLGRTRRDASTLVLVPMNHVRVSAVEPYIEPSRPVQLR